MFLSLHSPPRPLSPRIAELARAAVKAVLLFEEAQMRDRSLLLFLPLVWLGLS